MKRRLLRTIPVLVALGALGFGWPFGPDGCTCHDVHQANPPKLSDEQLEDLQREEGRPHERRPPDEQLRPEVQPEHTEGGGY